MNPTKPIEDLLSFLTDKIEKLPETFKNQEYIYKLDQLIHTNIDESDIKRINTFIQFCLKKIQDLMLSSETYKKHYINYSNLVNECNNLNNKINELKDKIKKLEDDKKLDRNRIASLESYNNELNGTIKGMNEKNTELESKITDLQNENAKLQETSNLLKGDNIQLKNKVEELTNITTGLKNKLIQDNENFEAAIQKLKKEKNDDIKKLKKEKDDDIEKLKNELESCMSQILNINQEFVESKGANIDIKERDNYNAIVYIILISTGQYTFEEIWQKIKDIISDKNLKIDSRLTDIFEYSTNFLKDTNFNSHNSTQKNILKKLFPYKESDLGIFFNDKILNSTKNIIHGMKKYYLDEKKDSAFKDDMKNIQDEINFNLQYIK